ncbi:MAG: type II CAAX endopeptidase family protein [Microcoleaceae cyanobacterium]
MKFSLSSIAQFPAPVRLFTFAIALVLLWSPVAIPLYTLAGERNWVSIVTLAVLYVEFIFLVRYWGKQVYQQPKLLQQYGLEGSRRNIREVIKGFTFGGLSVFFLFGIQGILGWIIWDSVQIQQSIQTTPQFILEGFAVALGIGFAEELVFRGWLIDELKRDYSQPKTVWISSIIFAILHFIKPPEEIYRTILQFPGLILLGLILAWGKFSTPTAMTPNGRLGKPIGFHGGLVWGYYLINVGQWINVSGTVPTWVTGIDDNPLAGIMGLLLLSAIAFSQYSRSQKSEV